MSIHPGGLPVDLRGFCVGITADRRSEEQAVLLRRLGVEVVAGPSMRTLPVPDGGDRLRGQVDALLASPPDYLVANTGIGVRNLFALAVGWGCDEELRQMLRAVRVVARGPKAAGALRLAGVEVWWRAPTEQLAEVRDRLLAEGMAGTRVVFQLHGDERQGLSHALRDAGAEVTEIEVYRWSFPADSSAVLALIEGCCAGDLDAVTFTAAPAVRNLIDLADTIGRAGELIDVLNREVVVGCVGPVCAAAATEEGLTSLVVPEHWRLGSLVKRVGEALTARRRQLRWVGPTGVLDMVLQGSLLLVGDTEVQLHHPERTLARVLSEAPGRLVATEEIVARLGRDAGAGGAAVAVSVERLTSLLGPAGPSLESPAPGVYRWAAEKLSDIEPGKGPF